MGIWRVAGTYQVSARREGEVDTAQKVLYVDGDVHKHVQAGDGGDVNWDLLRKESRGLEVVLRTLQHLNLDPSRA